MLARVDGEPVLVQQENPLAATFHPELTPDARVHLHLLSLARRICAIALGRAAGR